MIEHPAESIKGFGRVFFGIKWQIFCEKFKKPLKRIIRDSLRDTSFAIVVVNDT